MTNNKTLIGSLQVILAGICWGSLGVFSSKLLGFGFDSFQIATLRIIAEGIIVGLLLPSILPILKNKREIIFSLIFNLIKRIPSP